MEQQQILPSETAEMHSLRTDGTVCQCVTEVLVFQGSAELSQRPSADSMDFSQADPSAAPSTGDAVSTTSAEEKPTLKHADSSLSSDISGNSESGAMPMEVDDDAMFEKKPSKASKPDSGQVRNTAQHCICTPIQT